MLRLSSFAILVLLPSALAHFILQYPNSLGFSDDDESTEPCGGFSIPSPLSAATNVSNIPVDRFAVALQTFHPQSQWLFRASLTGSNWTELLPVVSQTGLGEFCLPDLKAPSEFAGQTGIIQVTCDAPDGLLYQCAVVHFVSGANTTVGPACTNATGLTATVTTDQNFTNATTTATGSTASATNSHSGAVRVIDANGLLLVALMVTAGLLTL